MTRRTTAGLVAGLLTSVVLILVVGVLAIAGRTAGGGLTGPGMAGFTTTPTPTQTTQPDPDNGGPKYGTVHNCAIVSSSSYLGMSCAGSSSSGHTIKQILGSSDVPGCWDEALTDDELAAMNVANKPGPDGWTYYWEKCLSGIDPKTKQLEPGGIKITIGLVSIDHGDPIKTLDANQQQLIDGYADRGNIPVPVAGVSPADHARVGGDVSFFDGTPGFKQVSFGSVVLRARIVSIDIEPLGPGRLPKISCPDTGLVAGSGDTPQSKPGGCWYRYLRSSAGQPQDEYPVQITAHWTVDSSADGGATFTVFNTFTKSAITRVPVKEVQALVVQ
ncbi:hypothetical protein [Marmoricola sp. URHA0025 HA25]